VLVPKADTLEEDGAKLNVDTHAVDTKRVDMNNFIFPFLIVLCGSYGSCRGGASLMDEIPTNVSD